jgi:hypothetical protein
MPVISVAVEVINKRKRIMVQVSLGKKPDPISKKKKKRTKRAIGVTTKMVACLPSKCKSEFKHQYHKKSTGSITHNNNNKILKAASSMTALSSSTSLYVTVRNAHIYSPDTHKSGEGITAHTAWKFRQPRCPSPEWVRTTFLQQITQQ